MAMDPTLMVDMMKKNLTGIVPQVSTLIRPLQWVGSHIADCVKDKGQTCS